jgi:hypothetical protein
MRNAPEVVREVGVDDFRVTTEHLRFHLDHRLLGISAGTVGILLWWKIGLKDRFQHQHRCCHADSIAQGRHAPGKLHSSPNGLWDRRKSFTRFILCAVSDSLF